MSCAACWPLMPPDSPESDHASTRPVGAFSLPVTIETERLVLHPLTSSDASAMLDAVESSRLELERWMRWPTRARDLEEVEHMVDESDPLAASVAHERGIFRRDEGRLVGGIDIRVLRSHVPSFALAYWLRSSDTGSGYAREAVLAPTQVAFHEIGARRVVIACDPENVRSARVAEACGYVLEARLRNEVMSPSGEVRDLLVHSLVDTDEVVQRLPRPTGSNGDEQGDEMIRYRTN